MKETKIKDSILKAVIEDNIVSLNDNEIQEYINYLYEELELPKTASFFEIMPYYRNERQRDGTFIKKLFRKEIVPNKDCYELLRNRYNISCEISSIEFKDNIVIVKVRGYSSNNPNIVEEAIGCNSYNLVSKDGSPDDDAIANAIMIAETKAKKRISSVLCNINSIIMKHNNKLNNNNHTNNETINNSVFNKINEPNINNVNNKDKIKLKEEVNKEGINKEIVNEKEVNKEKLTYYGYYYLWSSIGYKYNFNKELLNKLSNYFTNSDKELLKKCIVKQDNIRKIKEGYEYLLGSGNEYLDNVLYLEILYSTKINNISFKELMDNINNNYKDSEHYKDIVDAIIYVENNYDYSIEIEVEQLIDTIIKEIGEQYKYIYDELDYVPF